MSAPSDNATALRKAAERGARRKGWRAALFLVVALVAALGAAFLLTRYMEARTAAARVPTVPVVVTDFELPEATEIRLETLSVIQWPASSVPEGTSSDPAALVGRVVRTRLVKGEPVLERHLAATDAGRGLAALLPAGMRAVAVRVDDVVGVAGFIHPGDNVDVIVTMRPTEGIGAMPVSKIVLQNISVLAVGKQLDRTERDSAKSIPATVATLMVDSEQSEMLALAASKGQLLLTLRSGLDDALVDTGGVAPPALFGTPKPSSVPAKSAGRVARARSPEPAPERDTIEILRGDLFEKREFARGRK